MILFTPSPSLLPPTGTAPQLYVAVDQSEPRFTGIVTMVPTEGLIMSPWKLHLFTTELIVNEDEGEPYRLVQYVEGALPFVPSVTADVHFSANDVCLLWLFNEPSKGNLAL